MKKFICIILLPVVFSFLFYNFFLKNDLFFGGFERVPHPHYNSRDGDITEKNDEYIRSNVWFDSHGTNLQGWLYVPAENKDNDYEVVVIMSHGFGGQKDMGLEKYAKRFVAYGNFAVLTFDYRNFGGSDGVPRNLVSPSRHIEDIHSAIEHVKKMFPKSKIAIWGTSFAGGHVLVAAAEYKEIHGDEKLVGVISQVGHINGFASSLRNIKRRGIFFLLKMSVAAITDFTLSKIGLGPVNVPLFCEDGKNRLCIMSISKEELELYFSKHPNILLGGWKNQCPARISLQIRKYNPIDYVDKIEVPVLFISAEKDVLCPAEYINQGYQIAKIKNPRSEIIEIKEINHFEIYLDKNCELTSKRIVSFLKNE